MAVGVAVGVGLAVAVGVGVGVGVIPQVRKKIDTLLESWLATARSCLPSPLKSPTTTETGPLPAPKLPAAAKLTGSHVAGVVIVRVNALVTVAPLPLKAVTVTVYVPAGCASVTRTTPVVGSPASVP